MIDKHPARLIEDLREFERYPGHDGIDMAPVRRAITFLESRLTEAAIHGCHHCDEGDDDEMGVAPCWWCGLRRTSEDDDT